MTVSPERTADSHLSVSDHFTWPVEHDVLEKRVGRYRVENGVPTFDNLGIRGMSK